MSSRSNALTQPATSSALGASRLRGVGVAPLRSVARARCKALLTEGTLVPRSSATSAACQRSTSRRMRTARCIGGRCCTAATNASRTDSRARTACSALSSVIGSSAASRPIGRAWRFLPSRMSRQMFLAMRWSHERSDARPSKSAPRQARMKVSWTASSASLAPSIRRQSAVSSTRWSSKLAWSIIAYVRRAGSRSARSGRSTRRRRRVGTQRPRPRRWWRPHRAS
jgi:hypothetical protein